MNDEPVWGFLVSHSSPPFTVYAEMRTLNTQLRGRPGHRLLAIICNKHRASAGGRLRLRWPDAERRNIGSHLRAMLTRR